MERESMNESNYERKDSDTEIVAHETNPEMDLKTNILGLMKGQTILYRKIDEENEDENEEEEKRAFS